MQRTGSVGRLRTFHWPALPTRVSTGSNMRGKLRLYGPTQSHLSFAGAHSAFGNLVGRFGGFWRTTLCCGQLDFLPTLLIRSP